MELRKQAKDVRLGDVLTGDAMVTSIDHLDGARPYLVFGLDTGQVVPFGPEESVYLVETCGCDYCQVAAAGRAAVLARVPELLAEMGAQ